MKISSKEEQKLKLILKNHSNNYTHFLQLYEAMYNFIENLEDKDCFSGKIDQLIKKIKI